MRFTTERTLLRSLAAFLALSALAPALAHAQAIETASKSTSISVFGGYLYQKPNNLSGNNSGVVAGANLTRYMKHMFAPSMEIRGMVGRGNNVNERSLLGGFRMVGNFHRFEPYIDAEAGGGTILFNHSTTRYEDRSFIYGIGGGFDYDVTAHFNFKTDLQVQRWNLSSQHPVPFHPVNVMVGISYHFPFRAWNRHQDFHY